MIYDKDTIASFYSTYTSRVGAAREAVGRPLTLCEKILFAHACALPQGGGYARGEDYATFRPDRVAMQDATAQMAILQFINAGRETSAVPATVHCDHLIRAYEGAAPDLENACVTNKEVYDFLRSASRRFGFGFWGPGAGIIHQIVLENYAFPGGMMVGTDSHTPNAGGLSMVAVGVGGADAVDVMTDTPWELKVPRIIGVELTGQLSGWASPKDVILHLAGILTTKGATNAIIEYYGPGAESLSATGKATICNMGAEVGATCSLFPYDEAMADYLRATGRDEVAALADAAKADLRADAEVTADPESYYDRIVRIDLSSLEPYVNGPFTPDLAHPAGKIAADVAKEGYPDKIDVCLIGSCTNSSYQDLRRAASVVEQLTARGLKPRAQLIICPGSQRVHDTAERDGILKTFTDAGALIMTNSCGPCIGQWQRVNPHPELKNTIITTFNRNFAKRADGNPNTYAFITSPEMAIGYAYTGRLSLPAPHDAALGDIRPEGAALPPEGFVTAPDTTGLRPAYDIKPDPTAGILIAPGSERLQRLAPFAPWDGRDMTDLPLLIKTKGKCTTDHISMAGPWLRFRGHLENISRNLLLGATNAFTGHTGHTVDRLTGEEAEVWQVAKHYKEALGGSVIVAEDNYGEGSSREHAAMEPRFLGVRAVIAKSFARIHETNLKKQGVLALTFARPADYDKVREGDTLTIRCSTIKPGEPIDVILTHTDGTRETIPAAQTYNDAQIGWMRAGGALYVKK